MQRQLDSVGEQLKASVKEEVHEDTDALGWGVDSKAADGEVGEEEAAHEEVGEEEDYDEELEEEDMEEDPDSWTAKDWDHMSKAGAKALHHDGVMDVDKWDDEMKRMKERWEQPHKGAWKIKAPWASKPSASKPKAWIRKHDQWGGECWSSGWYKDSSGRWWPSLSNRFSG